MRYRLVIPKKGIHQKKAHKGAYFEKLKQTKTMTKITKPSKLSSDIIILGGQYFDFIIDVANVDKERGHKCVTLPQTVSLLSLR